MEEGTASGIEPTRRTVLHLSKTCGRHRLRAEVRLHALRHAEKSACRILMRIFWWVCAGIHPVVRWKRKYCYEGRPRKGSRRKPLTAAERTRSAALFLPESDSICRNFRRNGNGSRGDRYGDSAVNADHPQRSQTGDRYSDSLRAMSHCTCPFDSPFDSRLMV